MYLIPSLKVVGLNDIHIANAANNNLKIVALRN